ncbi:MAG: glycosyltransferase [Nakamurella sp.]
MTPDVSVVIPYFDDQPRLTLLLLALRQQVVGISFDVVIADDGSPVAPVVPAGLGFHCTVVRQQDHGFRAAAARNLGAQAATGRLLLFLDGDTVPAAGYLGAMADTLHEVDDGHGALVVGRRRHADLTAAGEAAALAFLRAESAAGTDAIRLLPDPQWLLDGYARTDNLRSAADEDFRLVISAVLGVDRRLWNAIGGFDDSFVGYGGEDWDLAWRAWLAGADFAYQPAAVAWHDGPDAAGRQADPAIARAVKNAESLRLAQTVALPSVRGAGLVLAQPEIAVRYLGSTTGTADDAAVVACVAGLLAGSDAAVWFPGCPSAASLPPLLRDDPRVHPGDIPAPVVGRSRFQVWVERPLTLPGSLQSACETGECNFPGMLRIRRTRSLNRAESATDASEGLVPQALPLDISLERWWAGW